MMAVLNVAGGVRDMAQRLMSRSLIGVFLTVAALILPTRAFAASHTPAPAHAAWGQSNKMVIAQAVSHLLQLINADRATHGAPPLSLDPVQSACSKKHTLHMERMNDLSHDEFPADLCVAHTVGAENVGMALGDPMEALSTIHQDMMSEGPCPHPSCPGGEYAIHNHYTNLMNKHFKRVGIGVVVKDGTSWITENFTG
jgi:hypothetical protein